MFAIFFGRYYAWTTASTPQVAIWDITMCRFRELMCSSRKQEGVSEMVLTIDQLSRVADRVVSHGGSISFEKDGYLRVEGYSGMRFTPRAVLIDLDKDSLEAVRSSPAGRIFKEENYIYGTGGTGNNWAKGHLSEGAQLCDSSLDVIRREVEACDCFHGFQVIHSIGGGTGGGLGSLLLGKIKDEYPGRALCTYSIIPSPRVSNSTVEPYNAVLTINHLIEHAEETVCIDNEALFFIASEILNLDKVDNCDVNYLISLAMTGITAPMRFPGSSNTSLKKIAVNLIPFPRMHFLVPSYAPLASRCSRAHRDFSVGDIVNQIFDQKRMFATFDPKHGSFLTVACLFRGELSMRDVDTHIQNIRDKNSAHFVEWIPDNIKTGSCYYPLPVVSKSATFLTNTTCIKDLLRRLKKQYLSMFRRKAFLHWYTGEGMEEQEFKAAESNLNDLVAEYKEYDSAKASQAYEKDDVSLEDDENENVENAKGRGKGGKGGKGGAKGAKEDAKSAKEDAKGAKGAKEDAKGAKEDAKGGAKDDAKGGAKEDAKGGTKEDAKGGAKEDAKGGAKEDAKGGTKEDAKGGAKEDAKGGAKEDAKGGAKEVAKGGVKEDAKGGAKEDAKGGAKEVAKGGVKEDAKGGAKEDPKGGAKGGAKEDAKGAAKEDAKKDVKKDEKK